MAARPQAVRSQHQTVTSPKNTLGAAIHQYDPAQRIGNHQTLVQLIQRRTTMFQPLRQARDAMMQPHCRLEVRHELAQEIYSPLWQNHPLISNAER